MDDIGRKMVQISKNTIETIREIHGDEMVGEMLASWINEKVVQICKKDVFLKKYAKHLEIIGFKKDTIVIKDAHLQKVVGVTLKDNRLWCDNDKNGDKSCMHKWFAMGSLEIGVLEDNEKS